VILHRLVLDDLLGGAAEPLAAESRISAMGDVLAADGLSLAAVAMPVGVGDVVRITETGERLPTGSTRFYPPVPCGLVFSPLG
jgi:ribosomal protein S4E